MGQSYNSAPMRLDSHQHFWSYSEREYDWIDERMSRIRRDFAPSDLEPILRRNGFDGSVAVQVRQSLEETEYLLRLADEHDFIRGVVGFVDLRSPGARRDLERLSEHTRFRGVRHVVQAEPDDRFLLRDDFLRGVALLRDLGLTYDILVYHRHLPAVIDFVARFPEHRLILDHMGKPAIAKAELEPWASSIRKLGKNENLYCKLSGLVTEADWSGWKKADFALYLEIVLESFGPRRLLFGSDWPVATLAASYEKVVEIVEDFLDPLSSAEKDAVFGGNAADFYRLEVAP
ncbi:MAG: amidohydrolase family protein [Vicinamibacteria bacterium]